MNRQRRVRATAQAALARRYRRLLAWYPSSPRFGHPVLLTAPQWTGLGAAPVLGLAAAMAWLGGHERMLRLVAAGQRDVA
jgi:hypothetical protein